MLIQGAVQTVKGLFFRLRRFIGFSLVGGLVFLLGIGFLSLQVERFHINPIPAGYVTTVLSVEVSFILNKYVNWRDRRGEILGQWWKFHLTRIGVIGFDRLAYTILVVLGVHYLVVTVFLTVVETLIHYIGNEKFAFQIQKEK